LTVDGHGDVHEITAVAPTVVVSNFDDEDDVPAPVAPVAAAKPAQKAEDILAMIRARQKQ
jgi:hypothetical protein